MLYEKNREKELKKELFENPTSEYRGTPFWSWNCRVTKELIHDQMEVFRKMGFGGAHLHPRTGLENEYMGEEFLDLVSFADEQAKDKDMLVWLYDEDRYPSGAAGGIVTENLEFRARHLLFTREKKEGMCASREEFLECVLRGEKPAGYYLTAYRIKTQDGYLASYRRILGPQPEFDSQEETHKEGRLWFAYVELMRESPWFNDQTYVDVMNQKAIEKFLEVTHEKYFEALGDEFGKSIPAIFTDEPQIKGSMALPDGESDADVTLSFTDDLPETFEKEYGVNLLDVMPELLWELPEGKHSVHRYHYHDHLAERFVSAFTDTIGKWCEEHHIAMTGHYMSEPTLYSQTLRLGEAMRCYRSQQLPGVDILCGDPEYSTVKQAVSVARQDGREGVLCEMYGVTHWDFDFKGHKLQGDWLAALGVTIRCHHLSYMSMEGEAKRDWPASINYQSPWWQKYSYIENYFARVNTALTRGRADVSVAVVHPIESYWMSYGPVAQTQGLRDQMDENFRSLIDWMLFGMVDFDFLSESLLPGQFQGISREEGVTQMKVGQMSYRTVLVPGLMTIRNTTLELLEKLADQGGKVIFMGQIPCLVDGLPNDRAVKLAQRTGVIPYQQYELLEALEEDRLVEARFANGHRSDNLFYQMRLDGDCKWLFVCHVNRKRNRVDQPENMNIRIRGEYEVTCYDALSGDTVEVEAQYRDGFTCVAASLYAEDSFLWKLTERKAELGSEEQKEADMGTEEQREKDPGSEEQKEADTGTEEQKETNPGSEEQREADQGRTEQETGKQGKYPVPTGALTSFYGLVAGPSGVGKAPERILATVKEPDGFSLAEPNVLLLDSAQWKLDDGEWNEKQEILRLDNEIRTIAGYPHRQDAYTQPWRIKEAPENHVVTLRYRIVSSIDTGELKLAMERPQKAKIWLNGVFCPSMEDEIDGWYVDSFIRTVKVPGLKAGVNELLLEIPYGRKTNLENVFLLGEFGVEVYGDRAVVTQMPKELVFGDVTRQKLPFYGGSITYTMHFTLDKEQEVSVRVPHFASPVLEVAVDQKAAGLIAFAPHKLSLGKLCAGEHELKICAYGNRFNSFGTLHNCNDEYKWYGPDSYRTRGSEWSETWCLRCFGVLSRVEVLEG